MLSPLRCTAFRYWHIYLHTEDHARFVGIRLHREDDTLVFLLAQPARLEQWHGGAAALAGYGMLPQVGHALLSIYVPIQGANRFFNFLQDPPPPVTHIPPEISC